MHRYINACVNVYICMYALCMNLCICFCSASKPLTFVGRNEAACLFSGENQLRPLPMHISMSVSYIQQVYNPYIHPSIHQIIHPSIHPSI